MTLVRGKRRLNVCMQVGLLSKRDLAWPFRIMPARVRAALGLNNLVFKGCSSVCDGSGAVLASADAGEAGVVFATIQPGQVTTVELQRFGASPCVSGLSKINFRLVDCGPQRLTLLFPSPLPFVWTSVLEPLGSFMYRFSLWRRYAARRAGDGAPGADGLVVFAPYICLSAAVVGGLLWHARNGGVDSWMGARR